LRSPEATREAQRRCVAAARAQRRAIVRDILPKLQDLPLRVIAEAMSASIPHGSKVRSGVAGFASAALGQATHGSAGFEQWFIIVVVILGWSATAQNLPTWRTSTIAIR